ncbi:hypothetical protein MKS88_002608 [Plasmodium brasilianum]|uniref:Uncharacterized protein n=1 Tax=Plasmodium brasilianum TaxID=5824 RepID=A0ACB9YB49_PLABR|nr:hypothetical protein MKS88_002608 [Plasmodium brasilianum]
MSSTSDNSWEKLLVGSPSYHIYKQFDNEVNEAKYDRYCSPFKNSGNGADLEYLKLCKKMSRNTDILSKYHNKNEFTTLCSHYRYWTYYNIKRVLGEKTGNDKAKPIIHKFMQTQNNINEIYNAYYCKYDFENDILERLNIMNEEKYLYDYFQNYDNIKTSDACNAVKSEEYEKYLNHIIELYNKHKTQKECCIGSFWPECEDYFKCNDEFDPKKLLSTLNSNISKKCDNLTNTQTTLTSGVTSHSGSSKADFRSSIYLVSCTDIPKDRPSVDTLVGSRIRCHVLPSSTASLNNSTSSFTHPRLIIRDNQVSSGSSRSRNHLSNSDASNVIKYKSGENHTSCEDPLLVRHKSGTCVEPDVRKTNTIGFTPFGRFFHKKVSRKKRTDDYYDDPYTRQFIIRAPKYGRRRTGNRGLQFSYYSSLETESRNLIIFLYNFEEKWLYDVIGIKEDFQSNLYDVFSKCIDNEWMEWLKPHILDYIPSNFERMFNENMSFYNKIAISILMN